MRQSRENLLSQQFRVWFFLLAFLSSSSPSLLFELSLLHSLTRRPFFLTSVQLPFLTTLTSSILSPCVVIALSPLAQFSAHEAWMHAQWALETHDASYTRIDKSQPLIQQQRIFQRA